MAWGGGKGGWQGGDGPWGRPPSGGGSGNGGGQPPGKPPGSPPTPPDLDKMLQRGRDVLKRMQPGDPNSKRGYVLLAAAAVLIWAASGIYFVRDGEVGIITRFGAFDRTTQPGIGLHAPYPFEAAQVVNVQAVNKVEVGYRSMSGTRSSSNSGLTDESLILTGDENIVEINFDAQWKIREAEAADFLFNLRNPEVTIKIVAESAMREVIGKTVIMTIISEGQGRMKAEAATRKLMQDMLDSYNAGVEITSVNMTKAAPPAQVIDAFRDVQNAKADMETARNQAEAYSNDIIPRARGEAEKIQQDAEAYKQEIVARAKGEASRFIAIYREYTQARDVTKKRIYLETMEEILQGMNKMIADKQGVVPYLPLDALKPAAGASKPAEEARQ